MGNTRIESINKVHLLGKLQPDILRVDGVRSLEFLRPLGKILDVVRVLTIDGPELGSIQAHKP